jgi:hypothetical protein
MDKKQENTRRPLETGGLSITGSSGIHLAAQAPGTESGFVGAFGLLSSAPVGPDKNARGLPPEPG